MKFGMIAIEGKTVKAAVALADGAGNSMVRIEFTDRTQLLIAERSKSGDLEWSFVPWGPQGQQDVDTKPET